MGERPVGDGERAVERAELRAGLLELSANGQIAIEQGLIRLTFDANGAVPRMVLNGQSLTGDSPAALAAAISRLVAPDSMFSLPVEVQASNGQILSSNR